MARSPFGLSNIYPSPVSWFEAASVTRPAAVAAGRLSRGARAGLIPKAGFRVVCPWLLGPGPIARSPFGVIKLFRCRGLGAVLCPLAVYSYH